MAVALSTQDTLSRVAWVDDQLRRVESRGLANPFLLVTDFDLQRGEILTADWWEPRPRGSVQVEYSLEQMAYVCCRVEDKDAARELFEVVRRASALEEID